MNLLLSVKDCITLLAIGGNWEVANKYAYAIYHHFVFILMALYNISATVYFFQILDSVEEAAAIFYFIFEAYCVLLKMKLFRFNFEKLRYSTIESLKIQKFQPQNEFETIILKKAVFKSRFVFHYYNIVSICAVTVWIITPLFNLSARQLPSISWFPYDYQSDKYYIPTYVGQGVGIFFYAFANIGIDSLFAILMIQISAQCDILNDRLAHFGDNTQCNERELRDELKLLVQNYRIVLTWVREIHFAYKYIALINFGVGVLVLCITMFKMSLEIGFTPGFFIYLNYQMSVFSQFFLYCWFGNDLIIKSSTFGYSLFKSNWFNCSKSVKQDVLLFIHYIQPPIILYFGSIFPISLETFKAMVRSSWTFYVALRDIHNTD